MTPTLEEGNSRTRKIMVVFGTRPEAIKMAPIVRALFHNSIFKPLTVITAQHREMLDDVISWFGLKADYDLDILRPGQSLTDISASVLTRLSKVLLIEKPDMLVVQGDTTTTFVGALAAFYHQIPVGHVEAGLRTGNALSPYPEEINRRLTTQLSTIHFAPTQGSKENLLQEHVPESRIYVTGNTVIDALLATVDNAKPPADPRFSSPDFLNRKLLLVTAHRRESWGAPLNSIALALRAIALHEPDVTIVVPLHKNPLVRSALRPVLNGLKNVWLIDAVPYPEFVWLMKRAHLILTDSGGIQEEAPALGVPVLVMRHTSERPEVIATGSAALVGTGSIEIETRARALLNDSTEHDTMSKGGSPYGDGVAAERVTKAIASFFGLGAGPPDFVLHGREPERT